MRILAQKDVNLPPSEKKRNFKDYNQYKKKKCSSCFGVVQLPNLTFFFVTQYQLVGTVHYVAFLKLLVLFLNF